jgi:SAM-dependent methyltransferase
MGSRESQVTYRPVEYWTERGKVFEEEARNQGWWGAENEPLNDLLSTLKFETVLEVGCGFGRVGATILSKWPQVRYTGMDVSPDLVAAASLRLPDSELFVADLATWDTDRKWDLVVSVSVLGHLLPTDIKQVITKMRRWAKHDLVTIDWDEVGKQTDYQFGHDYRNLYPKRVSRTPIGRLAMYHLHG